MPKRLKLLAALLAAASVHATDLRHAAIVAPAGLTGPEKMAATLLADEIERRTRIRLPITTQWPAGPAIFTGRAVPARFSGRLMPPASGAEGYRVQNLDGNVLVVGNDSRGTLFGAGALLRHLHMDRDTLEIADDLRMASAPKVALRGHQLGYRPKTNSYDGWTVAMWEQYMRDLIVFGANAIELIPPRSDDDADSPHFPLPPMQMMVEMSRLADKYGLDVWIWYPAMDRDYGDPKTVDFALKEWAEVFRQLPRINAVFVPGGDPGHTAPKNMLALLEKQTESLHRFHPRAQMWMSPQSFDKSWDEEFLAIVKNQQPAWLSGVVFGPQVRMSLPELRKALPARYPIRLYPDITHSRQAQYPVPDWDVAFAVTEARETINPRPVDEAAIFHATQPYTVGFLSYSEGCNDDVNKAIWSALGWNPDTPVEEIVHDFARYFIGGKSADTFAEGLMALERDWRGPLADNAGVDDTLRLFQGLEKSATPAQRENWRFQQALYRAYYDAYTRKRLIYETGLESAAMDALRNADMAKAEETLNRAVTERTAPELRARIFELAEALFQSIHMQLSVTRYQAISVDRGANLDTVDAPLNNREWLKARFAALRNADEAARKAGIEEILHWTDAGPGGFYDDLGNLKAQPHLVRGASYAQDPDFRESPLVGFGGNASMRDSWWTQAESLYNAPLKMHYEGLDPKAEYKIRVVYGGDSPRVRIRLDAGDGLPVHPLMTKPAPVRPIEFPIPRQAYAGGTLDLTWHREEGLGGNGRGCQVSEVWLLKQ